MSKEALDALRARVHDDADLARRLHGIEPGRFLDEVQRIEAEIGCAVTAADLGAAIAQGRQAWGLRWIL